MNGILIIDKPSGMTSHDVVQKIRHKFHMRRVGHAGTLDPLATGILVLLLGKATKLSNRFLDCDKAYAATMRLGTVTDTADIEGEVLSTRPYDSVTPERLEDVMKNFRGEQDQLPPMYSAVRFKGKKLYELARQGIEVERQPRRVTIHQLRVESFSLPDVQFYMECSKGTYVRQLAADVGERLGCGACITQIRRVKSGSFVIQEALSLSDVNESHLRDWQEPSV